jgi:hypothetical protein
MFTRNEIIAYVAAFIMFFGFVDLKNPGKLDFTIIIIYSICALLLMVRIVLKLELKNNVKM